MDVPNVTAAATTPLPVVKKDGEADPKPPGDKVELGTGTEGIEKCPFMAARAAEAKPADAKTEAAAPADPPPPPPDPLNTTWSNPAPTNADDQAKMLEG